MKDRCHNPKSRMYSYYGARGIWVCDQWRNSFASFIADVGLRPDPKLTLDRIDNNLGYFPGNVQWATRAHQVRNRRNNVVLEHNGERILLQDLAVNHGMLPQVVRRRMLAGAPLEEALVLGHPWRGERNSQSKLDPAQVSEIRRMLEAGVKQRVVAIKFGVSQSAISLINIGKNWAHA